MPPRALRTRQAEVQHGPATGQLTISAHSREEVEAICTYLKKISGGNVVFTPAHGSGTAWVANGTVTTPAR
jgi:hypothetical protein